MEELLKQMLSEIRTINQRLDNLEGQVKENTDIIKAIQHNTEVINAKIDGLTINTASKDSVANLDAKFDVLNNRLFQQEAAIHQLKAVK